MSDTRAERPVRTAIVVLAGGSGSRVGRDTNKVLLDAGERTLLGHALATAATVPGVVALVVVVRAGDEDAVERELDRLDLPADLDVRTVTGGTSRHGSEWNALKVLRLAIEAGDLDVVAIHDGARPLATVSLYEAVIEAALRYGGALPGVPASALVRRDGGPVPDLVVGVQTPQAFRAGPLLDSYVQAEAAGFEGTDTASCVERFAGLAVHCVPGDPANVKVTFPEDVLLAEHLLR